MSGRTIEFDPHVHTDASCDANGTVEEVLSHCHDSLLDAVAITDHDTTVAAREALEKQHQYDITVVPGVEISTADRHLLALDVIENPRLSAGHSPRQSAGLARTEASPSPHIRSSSADTGSESAISSRVMGSKCSTRGQ